MSDLGDIKKLASLARLAVAEEDIPKLTKDLGAILEYVSELSKAPVAIDDTGGDFRDTLRADGEPHESGLHTETLLAASPARKDNYFVVKKILNND